MSKSGNYNSKTSKEKANVSTSTFAMELDLAALSGKNRELTKENVMLKAEIAELRAEVISLRNQLINEQHKIAHIKQDFKNHAPNFALLLTSILEFCESDAIADNRKSLPAPSQGNSLTQRVGPHMVNGVVLNVNPQVSLTRMDNSSTSLPSTSMNRIEQTHSESLSLSNDNTNSPAHNVQDGSFSLRSSDDENQSMSLENKENEDSNESKMLSSQQSRDNLSTIWEESSHANLPFTTEVQITLTRMSIEEMRSNSFIRRRSSTEALANDSCLSFETTIIKQETSTLNEVQPVDASRTNYTENSKVISASGYLATPSMSAMGDIDGNYSHLNATLDSGMTSTPTNTKSRPASHSSPRSSKELTVSRKSRRRIPIVVLENLRDLSIQLQSGDNTQSSSIGNNSETKSRSNSYLNPLEIPTKSKKSKKSKSSIKRKLPDDEEAECELLSESNSLQSCSSRRPARSAKPADLKEKSLKQKMRRT